MKEQETGTTSAQIDIVTSRVERLLRRLLLKHQHYSTIIRAVSEDTGEMEITYGAEFT